MTVEPSEKSQTRSLYHIFYHAVSASSLTYLIVDQKSHDSHSNFSSFQITKSSLCPPLTPVLRHHLQHFPASATRQRRWQWRGGSSVVGASCAGPWWSGAAGLEKQMTRRWHLREEKKKETSKSFISSYLSISSIRFIHQSSENHPIIKKKQSIMLLPLQTSLLTTMSPLNF